MTRWLSVTWWTWTAQHTCLRAPAQQARFDGEEYSMKRNISNIFTYILLNNKPGLPEKNTRCLRHHGKRIHHWNQFFILHHPFEYHQKRRRQAKTKERKIVSAELNYVWPRSYHVCSRRERTRAETARRASHSLTSLSSFRVALHFTTIGNDNFQFH